MAGARPTGRTLLEANDCSALRSASEPPVDAAALSTALGRLDSAGAKPIFILHFKDPRKSGFGSRRENLESRQRLESVESS